MTTITRATTPAPAAPTTAARPSHAASRAATTPAAPAPAATADPRFFSSDDALLVRLAARPDGAAIESMPRGAERKAAAWSALTATAAATQQPFVDVAKQLQASGAIEGYQTLVSPNMLIIDPAAGHDAEVIKAFSRDGVAAIYANRGGAQQWPAVAQATTGPTLVGPQPLAWGYDDASTPGESTPLPPAGVTPGLSLIGAPEAWKAGADGHGLVYGSIDSGVAWDHPALKANYRGTSASGRASHNYSWIDFLSADKTPADAREHGTHTIGTVVGHTKDAEFGVAPAAKFISARATGSGHVDSALRALQWMQAPTRTDGTRPRADKAPDVVGMSWFMGSPSQELFRDSIRNLRLAGIEVVKSAGNNGPGEGTITSPGQFPEILATAAVDAKGNIADFSSRGPAPFPAGSTTPKPDFAAPGVDIVSTVPTGYDTMSGTSMAQPHLSGVILDMLSKYPQLTHDQLVQVLASSATDKGAPGRDAMYGMGVVNLPGALAAAEKLVAATTPPAS